MLALLPRWQKLAHDGAQLVVLQELHDTHYFCQHENIDFCSLAEPIPGEATEFYSKVASDNKVVLVASLFERRAPGLYHNTAVVFETDGTIAGKYRKMPIPDDPAYYGNSTSPRAIWVSTLSILRLVSLGAVCWDQWYPEAARMMALAGAEILVILLQ